MTGVTIQEGVEDIEAEAFRGCKALSSVVLPESMERIDVSAFQGCKKITFTVPLNTYAEQYCKDNGLSFVYPE